MLLNAGVVRAQDERGQSIDPRDLERKQVGKAVFKVEAATVTTPQRIQVRKLLQKMGLSCKQGEELSNIPKFLAGMGELADRAGGAAPKPQRPDTSVLDEIRLLVGNEQILAIYNRRDELKQAIEEWSVQAVRIEDRELNWSNLQRLLTQAGDIKAGEEARHQVEAILRQRLLLTDPDPVEPLLKSMQDALRKELKSLREQFVDEYARLILELQTDSFWSRLSTEDRQDLLKQCEIENAPEVSLGTLEDLITTLDRHPIKAWNDRIDALSGRFARVRVLAAQSLEPETQVLALPRETLKTPEDVDAWIEKVRETLMEKIRKGPVIV